MAYSKTTWKDNEAPYLNASNLNKMETGIDNNDAQISYVENKLTEDISNNTEAIEQNAINIADNRTDIDINSDNILGLSVGEVYQGTWTPEVGTEYPSSPEGGWSYYIQFLDDNGYTFTTGDLSGRIANNSDKIIYNGTSWSMIDNTNEQLGYYLVDDIESMLGLSPLQGALCQVYGYYSANDGGGGTFNYDSAQAGTNNGGTILNGWVRQYDGAVNVRWFGAVSDADEVLGTGTDSTTYIQSAINYCQENEKPLHIDGTFLITSELVIRNTLYMFGNGNSLGYSNMTETNIISGFVAKGTGTKRIQSRVLHRASSADPQDAPMSYLINNEADNTHISNLCVFLWFDRTDTSPTNYGDDWDVGIFNGCRVHFKLSDVHVLGYWREAAVWQDVTRASNLPELSDPWGVSYEEGAVESGADGTIYNNCIFYGGKWGVKVQGAQLATGVTDPTDRTADYYDETLGSAVSDWRGNFGNSDFDMYSCSVYGTDHFSRWRRNDIRTDLDYEIDTAGGAMSLDGLAGNTSGMIQGMRFYSCRFSSFEPYRIRLGYVNRPQFDGCHIEPRTSSENMDTAGNPIDTADYGTSETDPTGAVSYGYATTIANTLNTLFVGLNSSIRGTTKQNWIASFDYYNEAFGATGGGLKLGGNIYLNDGRYYSAEGEADLRGDDGVKFREGSTTLATINSTSGLTVNSSQGVYSTLFRAPVGEEFDARSGDGQIWRARTGDTTFFRHDPTFGFSIFYGILRPDQSGTQNLGATDALWNNVYGVAYHANGESGVSGTFANPTSITVTGGIITAIS